MRNIPVGIDAVPGRLFARSFDLIRAFVLKLSRPAKRAILLSVDIVLMAASYLLMLNVQGAGPADFGGAANLAIMIGAMLFTTGSIAWGLRVPNIKLNAYDTHGMGWIAIMAGLVALVAVALHRLAGAPLNPAAFLVFAIVFFVLSAASRVAMLHVLTALYRSRAEPMRVVIYGAGRTGLQLARALATHETVETVAFVDDNVTLQGLTMAGLPVLRPVDMAEIAAARRVDRVLLAMPSMSRPKLMQLARRLEAVGLDVQALPSFSQLIGGEALLDKFRPVPTAALIGRKAWDRGAEMGCSQICGRSVLVSGGGGSIGAELCRQVIGCKPRRLVIFELSELALYEVERALAPLAAEVGTEIVPVLGSVTEARLVRQVIAENAVDVVLHAAAYKHVPMVERNPLVGLSNNVLGTWVLAREADNACCERFILISSDKAVRPTNMMGASKRLAEQVVQDLALRSTGTIFAMVRFGNVVGSSGSVIPLFQEQIARGGPVTVTHREVTRYFMTPEEAVSLVLVAGSFARGGEVFVLDMGQPVRIWDFARRLIEDANYTVRDADNPEGDIEIVETGLRPGEKLHEELLIGEGHRRTAHEKIYAAHEISLSELDVARAIRDLRAALDAGDEGAAAAVAHRYVEGYGDVARAALSAADV